MRSSNTNAKTGPINARLTVTCSESLGKSGVI